MKTTKTLKYAFLTIVVVYLIWFIFHNFTAYGHDKNKKMVNKNITVAVINLDRSPHRMMEMKKILEEYGFERITRIDAVDGKKVSRKKDLPTYEGLLCLNPDEDTGHLTHTACYLSHLKALRYAMTESPTEWTLILEDDACFNKTPSLTMKILTRCITNSWRDIIWLTETTAVGYLVNKKGAHLFYSYLNQKSDFTRDFKKNYNMTCLYDWAMAKVFEQIPYQHYPTFIGQRNDLVSDITGDVSSKSILEKIRNFLFSFEYY